MYVYNDYEYRCLLFDVLSYGFISFEVDVYLINEILYVVYDIFRDLDKILFL